MKKYLIIIISFLILALLVTCMLINYNNVSYLECEEKGFDINSLYDENDLLVKEKNIKYNDVNYVLPRISGLKNSKVENKINKEIQLAFEKIIDNGAIKIKYDICANYSNIFSIVIKDVTNEIESEDRVERAKEDINVIPSNIECLNYNLVNGELIEFEDLFTKDAPLFHILYDAFISRDSRVDFLTKAVENEYLLTFFSYKMDLYDRLGQASEDVAYNNVNDFMNSKDKKFLIYLDKIITFEKGLQDNVSGIIYFKDNANYIETYDRYLTNKSIFKNDKVGKENLIKSFDTSYKTIYDSTITAKEYNGFIGDNYYVSLMSDPDISNIELMKENDIDKYNKYLEIRNNKLDELMKDIKKLGKTYSKDKNNHYVSIYRMDDNFIYTYECLKGDIEDTKILSNAINFKITISTFVIPNDLWNDKYQNELIETIRKVSKDNTNIDTIQYSISGILNDDKIKTTKEEKYETINYITNKKINKLEDMFNDVITMDVLYDEALEGLTNGKLKGKEKNSNNKITLMLNDGVYYKFSDEGILIYAVSNNVLCNELKYYNIDIALFNIFDYIEVENFDD